MPSCASEATEHREHPDWMLMLVVEAELLLSLPQFTASVLYYWLTVHSATHKALHQYTYVFVAVAMILTECL